MTGLEDMLVRYRQDHTHPLNRATHLVGIPLLAIALPVAVIRPTWGLLLLVIGGALQLLGHAFEGNTPSFVRDPRFVVVGAAWYARRLGLGSRVSRPAPSDVRPDHEIAVIGAGLAGLGAGVRLRLAGIDDFVLLEKSGEVGGTWKVNTYPGVAVDTNSFNYAYSFVPYAGWTRAYAPGAEVAAYTEHLADAYDLRPNIRFDTRVRSAHFDEAADLWRLELADGSTLTCRFLIQAPGGLTQPKRPDIPGLDTFAGPVVHTAEWDPDLDLAGKRVAVIGTGASAVQVVPAIAPDVGHLSVFQRTPVWVFPKPDFEIPPRFRALVRAVPPLAHVTRWLAALPGTVLLRLGTIHHQRMPAIRRFSERLMLRHLERQVADPALRAQLTPSYGFGCKRPVISSAYWASFEREDVSLVTDAIIGIDADGIRTQDGTLHPVDVIVLATGFKVYERGNTPPYPVVGLDGLELGTFWHEQGYQAYQACTLPQWPNMFMLTAPYGLGGPSYTTMVEAALSHALRVMRTSWRQGATRAAVRPEAHDAYHAALLKRRQGTVFYSGACGGANSYYFDHRGDAVAIRPHLWPEIWLHSRLSPMRHYTFGRAA